MLVFIYCFWIALTEHFQMSTHLPGFQSYSGFLHHFVLAKLATSSIIPLRVNTWEISRESLYDAAGALNNFCLGESSQHALL